MTTFTTTFGADFASEVHATDDRFLKQAVRRGQACLRLVGIGRSSDDLSLAAYCVWRDLSREFHSNPYHLDEVDYLVVGDISDTITDHDAELMVEMDPAVRSRVGTPAGSMTPEVTAVHDLLLEVADSLVKEWTHADQD